ncbi:MAG: hypothetical protein CG438_943, partial [Methylococcaceae bacterium NSP1-1]
SIRLYGKQVRQQYCLILLIPDESPADISSTVSTYFHQDGQVWVSIRHDQTASTGAGISQVVVKENWGMAMIFINNGNGLSINRPDK